MNTRNWLLGILLLGLTACGSGFGATPTPTASLTPLPSQTPTPLPTATETLVPSPTPIPLTELCTPLADHDLARITSYISNAYVETLTSNGENGHHGVDFSYYRKDGVGGPIDGTPVQTMLDGRVVGLGFDRLPYGNMVVVETPYAIIPPELAAIYQLQPGQSLYLLYGHMLENPTLAIGDPLTCGQQLGLVGNSGFSGNPHLHLETRVGPSGIDMPTMIFYDTTATLEEQANYTEWRQGETWTKYSPNLLLDYAMAISE